MDCQLSTGTSDHLQKEQHTIYFGFLLCKILSVTWRMNFSWSYYSLSSRWFARQEAHSWRLGTFTRLWTPCIIFMWGQYWWEWLRQFPILVLKKNSAIKLQCDKSIGNKFLNAPSANSTLYPYYVSLSMWPNFHESHIYAESLSKNLLSETCTIWTEPKWLLTFTTTTCIVIIRKGYLLRLEGRGGQFLWWFQDCVIFVPLQFHLPLPLR